MQRQYQVRHVFRSQSARGGSLHLIKCLSSERQGGSLSQCRALVTVGYTWLAAWLASVGARTAHINGCCLNKWWKGKSILGIRVQWRVQTIRNRNRHTWEEEHWCPAFWPTLGHSTSSKTTGHIYTQAKTNHPTLFHFMLPTFMASLPSS